jgi:hypothetical protein
VHSEGKINEKYTKDKFWKFDFKNNSKVLSNFEEEILKKKIEKVI